MPRLAALTLPSLTPEVCKALSSVDVKSVEDVLFADPSTLSHRSGINQEVIAAIVMELKKQYTATPVLGSSLYWDYMHNACIVPTGSTGLDYVLDGGLWGGEMTELVGQPSTGKTQICMYSALNTTKQNKTVLYFDTANSFSADRLQEMFQSSSDSPASSSSSSQPQGSQEIATLLNRINCRKCFDAFELLGMLYDLQAKLTAKDVPFYASLKLVVIDSIGALLSPIVGGKQQQGHALMMSIARLIKDIASEFHIAFLVTNYVVSGGDADRATYKAALGMSWQYTTNTQVMLSHQNIKDPADSSRRATLTKSSHAPRDRNVIFQIDAQGITSN